MENGPGCPTLNRHRRLERPLTGWRKLNVVTDGFDSGPTNHFACARPRSLVLAGLHIRSVRQGGEREEERGERRKVCLDSKLRKRVLLALNRSFSRYNSRLVNYDAIETHSPRHQLHTPLSTEEDLMTALGERQNGRPNWTP
jgi:hypothetical protein